MWICLRLCCKGDYTLQKKSCLILHIKEDLRAFNWNTSSSKTLDHLDMFKAWTSSFEQHARHNRQFEAQPAYRTERRSRRTSNVLFRGAHEGLFTGELLTGLLPGLAMEKRRRGADLRVYSLYICLIPSCSFMIFTMDIHLKTGIEISIVCVLLAPQWDRDP